MTYWKAACLLFAALLSGCDKYAVTVNEREIYSPPKLFTQFEMKDARLRGCIDQTIEDKGITHPHQLTQLSCTNAGIETLSGIGLFSQLRAINLSDNKLTDISPLGRLGQLEELYLRANAITAAPVILNLLKLRKLDISENPQLSCRDLNQLQSISNAELALPAHCQRLEERL